VLAYEAYPDVDACRIALLVAHSDQDYARLALFLVFLDVHHDVHYLDHSFFVDVRYYISVYDLSHTHHHHQNNRL
jgi:hypothetical protein